MKRKLKRRWLTRPADAFLPAALLGAAFLNPMSSARVFNAMLLVRLCGLCTATSLRAAFARQPSMKDVQGSARLALRLQVIGAGIAAALTLILMKGTTDAWRWAILAGLCLNVEQIFDELLYAIGDGWSAGVARFVTAALTFTGIALSGNAAWIVAATSGIAALVAIVAHRALGGRLKGKLNATPIRCAPVEIVREILYPAAFFGICHWPYLMNHGLSTWMIPAFFAGLTLFSLCRTTFRRSKSEAMPLTRALLIVCAVCGLGIAGAALIPGVPAVVGELIFSIAGAAIVAAIAGFALFGNVGRAEY